MSGHYEGQFERFLERYIPGNGSFREQRQQHTDIVDEKGKVVRKGVRKANRPEKQFMLSEGLVMVDEPVLCKVSQLDPEQKMTYAECTRIENSRPESQRTCRRHIGQLKLWLTELLFLVKYQHLAKDIIYVGAADGFHTTYLAQQFPDHHFHLWDKSPFLIDPRIKNITMHRRYFFSKDAQNYRMDGKKYLFISDIRDVGVCDLKQRKAEETMFDCLVRADNTKQMEWVEMIQPVAASLKLRFPYTEGTTEYLEGTMFLQPFGLVSTEALMFCTPPYERNSYFEHVQNDMMFAYFNVQVRPFLMYQKWEDLCERYQIQNHWDNAYAFEIVYCYLKLIGKDATDDEVAEEYLAMVKALQQEYMQKLDVVFTIDSSHRWPHDQYDAEKYSVGVLGLTKTRGQKKPPKNYCGAFKKKYKEKGGKQTKEERSKEHCELGKELDCHDNTD
jgi:hypothetical protein